MKIVIWNLTALKRLDSIKTWFTTTKKAKNLTNLDTVKLIPGRRPRAHGDTARLVDQAGQIFLLFQILEVGKIPP